jgi:hypothetical protein
MYETMSRDDLMQSLGIVLANEPASMDAYNIFRNLNQTSKSTRAKICIARRIMDKEIFRESTCFRKND